MLQNIPTHVIAGPLGAGKTSLIKQLLTQKPAHERWAVLINEFGQIGLDAALLSTAEDGIALGEVAGGCLCCVNGAPFQIGLGRLLRKARPDRLFIEPSGLGHPLQLLKQLHEAPWKGVLAVQPSVMVLDAQALAAGKPLQQAQQEAIAHSGLLVLNKSDAVSAQARQSIVDSLGEHIVLWTKNGVLPLHALPGVEACGRPGVDNFILPRTLSQLPAVWADPLQPICVTHQQPEGWSIGWRWHPECLFDVQKLENCLQRLKWQRAKMVIHSHGNWLSANALEGSDLVWLPSEWRNDSRLEMIFGAPQDERNLNAMFTACLT